MKTKSLFGLAVLLVVGSVAAQAALTGAVTLQGSVPTTVSVAVTGQGTYNNLDLATSQTDLLVANVQEQSNDALGYKVTVASANAGLLKNGTLGSVTYTAKYNSTVFTLSITPVQVTNQGNQTTVVNATKPLTISYTGVAPTSLMAGTYSDTLTFTISAN